MKSGDWAHMFEPFNGYLSMCVEVIFSLSCLNWFSFKVDSILCRGKIFLDLNLSNSSMVFGNIFCIRFQWENLWDVRRFYRLV